MNFNYGSNSLTETCKRELSLKDITSFYYACLENAFKKLHTQIKKSEIVFTGKVISGPVIFEYEVDLEEFEPSFSFKFSLNINSSCYEEL